MRVQQAGTAFFTAWMIAALLALPSVTVAGDTEFLPQGEAELRLCTQNLFRLGEKSAKRKRDKPAVLRQAEYLVERMKKRRCDVVAVQEVFGQTKSEARRRLNALAYGLSRASGRRFTAHVGDAFEEEIRCGFLVAESIGEVEGLEDYRTHELPMLQPLGPVHHFNRGPLGLRLLVKPRTSAPAKRFFIVNMHLKSKAEGWKDPSRTDFEALRMEMAEGLRELALSRSRELGEGTVLVVLGDRNSDAQSASADILTGRRKLEDFGRTNGCRLGDGYVSVCEAALPREPVLDGVFQYRNEHMSGGYPWGSYRYRGIWSLIDEILIKPQDRWMVLSDDKTLTIGLEGELYKGSDHRLLWADFNW